MMDALDEEELVVSLVFRMQLPSRHTFRSQTPARSALAYWPGFAGIWPPDVPKRPLMSRASVLHSAHGSRKRPSVLAESGRWQGWRSPQRGETPRWRRV